MAATGTKRAVTVETAAGKDLLVESFTGVEGISRLYTYHLELTAKAPVEAGAVLGKPATIRASGVELGGIVSRFGEVAGSHRYRIEIAPPAWLLTRGAQSRIFQNKSVPDILQQVLGDAASAQLQATYPQRAFCVQYRETDFAFASRLMEEEGIFYFFEHPSGKMVLADAPQAVPALKSPLQLGAFASWETAQEIRANKVTLRDHTFELPNDPLEASKLAPASVTAGAVSHSLQSSFEIYDFPGGYAKLFDGVDAGGGERPSELQKVFNERNRAAEVRIQEEVAQAVVVNAQPRATIVSGRKLTLQGDPRAAGDYVVTRVEHSILQGESEAEPRVENRLEAVPAAIAPRPRRTTPRPFAGLQTAVVVGPAGEKVFTDKYGRVKVQFPWDRQGRSDANSSGWVRVGQIAASKQRGAMFVPRVGDEVLVDFLEGDPDQPVIVGSVYNAENMPALALPQNRETSYLHGRSPARIEFTSDAGLHLNGSLIEVGVGGEKGPAIHVKSGLAALQLTDGNALLSGSVVDLLAGQADDAAVNLLAGEAGLVARKDGTVTLKGQKIEAQPSEVVNLRAGDAGLVVEKGDIDLQTGDAHVRLKKDGSLLLTGKDVDVHADGAAAVPGGETVHRT